MYAIIYRDSEKPESPGEIIDIINTHIDEKNWVGRQQNVLFENCIDIKDLETKAAKINPNWMNDFKTVFIKQ